VEALMSPNDKSDEPMSVEKQGAQTGKAKPPSPSADQGLNAELVGLTVERATGRIVRVEAVDAAGTRHELSDEERAKLAATDPETTLESIVEQAFEAGIDCVLGGVADDDEPEESGEDAELRRALLRSLIDHSTAKRLMEPEVLGRAIVGALIADVANSRIARPPS
jgi:hypothetical protein